MVKLMSVELRPGDRIGNYRLEAELGPTGSGVLLHGRHLVLPRQAIIKVVHPAFAAFQSYALQTLREACILEAISHPGVPIVYESGVLRDRRPWFAFELIGGPTLDELLLPGAITLLEVAGLLRDLSDILAHAHRRGVIHRGLRPDRIVITSERRFALCIPDWSEAIAHDAATDTLPASPDGTGSYRAPELVNQLAGSAHELVDDRADMFSLGVIGYRALTGELPFAAPGDDAPHVPALDLRPDAPRELAAIVDALLAYDRFDRPSASEVRADLDWLFDSLPDLRARPTLRDGQLARARTETEPRVAAVQARADGTGPVTGVADRDEPAAPRGELMVLGQPRLRRPRWTPDVSYLEATHVDIQVPEDDLTKE